MPCHFTLFADDSETQRFVELKKLPFNFAGFYPKLTEYIHYNIDYNVTLDDGFTTIPNFQVILKCEWYEEATKKWLLLKERNYDRLLKQSNSTTIFFQVN